VGDTELGIGAAPTVNDRPSRMKLDAPSIPGYRIDKILGEGGMGTVYAAEQDAPRRQVAIKVLHGRSGNALVRFQAEAEIMAHLDHPGIARVLEAGEADGHPFLVMEHVEGQTLDRFVKGLALDNRLELFLPLCEAVHYAHLKGVIHRDLKPSNVMVRDGKRVVVLDFGVARVAGDDGKTPGQTRAGELIGTPLYMSPEQARLRPDEVDVRTDVYTLGVMLYELACGELPYNATKDVPLPILTCMICEDPTVPLAKYDPRLRGDLEAITAKALAKDPAERYQSVAALGDDVRRYLTGLPVSVRQPSTLERARRFVKRRPVLAAAVAAAVMAATAFAVVVTWLYLEASTARRSAEDARGRTESARALLESRTNQLVLRQARGVLARDPTEAIAWLATLTPRDVDPGTAWAIANEAIARGVAKDVLRGHADEVHWVEPLPGGFVSAAYDGRVILWDPAQRPLFVAKQGRVHAARPAPNGSEIAIGGDDGELHVVSRDGAMLAELAGHVGDVQHLAWSPGPNAGAWLATGDDHGNLFVWPKGRGPGKKLDTASKGESAIGSLAFSPDGTRLVAGDHAGNVWAWDVATGARVTATGAGDIVEVWSDGTRLAAVDGSGAVRTWKRDGDKLVVEHVVATALNCKRAVFAADGTWAVLGGVGGTVTRVVIDDGTIEPVAHFRAQVRSLAISSDARWIAAGGDDGSLEARDRTTGQVIALHGHTGRIRHVAFADGDRVLLSSDSDGIVRRWELATMPATVLDTRGEPAERIAIAADGSALAMVDAAGDVALWTFADRRYTKLGRVDGRATAIAIANGTVITGSTEGVVTWWTKTPLQQPLHGIVKDIAVGHDLVAVATSAGPIAVFTIAGAPRPALAGHPGGSDAVAIDPSGTLAVSGGQDRSIRVWKLAGALQVATLDGPRGDTHFVAVTRQLVVAAGNDGTILAWPLRGVAVDAPARKVVAQHTGAVTALAVTDTAIASAGRDATIARARIVDGIPAAAETTTIPASAIALALAADGALHAVTRIGAAVRWSPDAPPIVEIDHGLRDGIGIPGSPRWVQAFDDGTYVIADTRTRSLDELRAALDAATTFQLVLQNAAPRATR
jgi:WD40 repeat protein